jgi:hypothetical protein
MLIGIWQEDSWHSNLCIGIVATNQFGRNGNK